MVKKPTPDPIVVRRRPSHGFGAELERFAERGRAAQASVNRLTFAAELDPEETKKSTLCVLQFPPGAQPIRRALVINLCADNFDVALNPAADGTLYIRLRPR
jgi:hypothetical protein